MTFVFLRAASAAVIFCSVPWLRATAWQPLPMWLKPEDTRKGIKASQGLLGLYHP